MFNPLPVVVLICVVGIFLLGGMFSLLITDHERR